VNADNDLLHDTNGNWNGKYLSKREGESDSQFLARAIEAGKHVTPQMLEQENAHNKRMAPLALAAASAAGPAMLAGEAGAAAPFVASQTPALAITGEATGEMIAGPSAARMAATLGAKGIDALKAAGAAHPFIKSLVINGLASAGTGLGGFGLARLLGWIGKRPE